MATNRINHTINSLILSESLALGYTAFNSAGAIVIDSSTVVAGLTTVPTTIALPSPLTIPIGHLIIIKDEAGTAASGITISSQGTGRLIDGQASILFAVNYGCLLLYSNGSHWFIIV